jgi:hypothetical protein
MISKALIGNYVVLPDGRIGLVSGINVDGVANVVVNGQAQQFLQTMVALMPRAEQVRKEFK